MTLNPIITSSLGLITKGKDYIGIVIALATEAMCEIRAHSHQRDDCLETCRFFTNKIQLILLSKMIGMRRSGSEISGSLLKEKLR